MYLKCQQYRALLLHHLKVNGFFEWVSGLKPGIRSVVTTGLQYLQVLLYIIKYEIKYVTVEL